MSNRRFEMYQYRQVICRMRLGETDRRIAKVGLMGRRKAAELREIAQEQGWLRDGPLPEDIQLATFFQPKRQLNPQTSLLLPYEDQVKGWWEKGIQGTTIHQALVRNYGFTGSYSSVRRFLQKLERSHPKATTILEFEPGEAAQVDFGTGPKIVDVFSREEISTWFFLMTSHFPYASRFILTQ